MAPSKKPTILIAGRLEPDNGMHIYLAKAKQLKSKYNFVIAGEGSLKSKFKSVGQIIGAVPNLDKYIAKADKVWASSYLTILQAFAAGKPVLAVYDNQLKRDYLKPLTRYLKSPRLAKAWAKQQTWSKLATLYLNLWQKH